MDKTLDARFKAILSALHKAYLKPVGFKKTGSNFRLYQPDGLGKIINFQKSQFNGDGECAFTINIGIYFEKDLENPNLRFKEYECAIRTRVPGISPRYTRDQWWVLKENICDAQLQKELETVLSEDVLPWLDRFSSVKETIRLGQAGAFRGMIILRTLY